MNEKAYIIFNSAWYDVIKEIPAKDREKLLLAILDYAFYQVEAKSLNVLQSSLFNIIRDDIQKLNKSKFNNPSFVKAYMRDYRKEYKKRIKNQINKEEV